VPTFEGAPQEIQRVSLSSTLEPLKTG
jgi:hypothetical protein